MAEKQIIIDVVLNSDEAKAQAIALTAAIAKQRIELAKQQKALKDSNGTDLEAAKSVSELTASIRENSLALTRSQKAANANANSMDALAASIAQLHAEQKQLDTSTEVGAKRFKELTAQLQEQRDQMNELAKASGNFKENIGRYAESIVEASNSTSLFGGAITNAIGMFGKAQQAFTAMSAVLAANPFGLIVVAIGLLVAALGKVVDMFFKGEEGAKIMAQATGAISAVFSELTKRGIALGEALYFLVTGDFEKAAQRASAATNDFANAMAKAVEEGGKLGLLEKTTADAILAAQLRQAEAEAKAERARRLRDEIETRNRAKSLEYNQQVKQFEEERRRALEDQFAAQEKLLKAQQAQAATFTERKALERELTAVQIERFRAIDDYNSRLTEAETYGTTVAREEAVARLEIKRKELEGKLQEEEAAGRNSMATRIKILEIEEEQALALLEEGTAEREAVIIDYDNKRRAIDLEYQAFLEETAQAELNKTIEFYDGKLKARGEFDEAFLELEKELDEQLLKQEEEQAKALAKVNDDALKEREAIAKAEIELQGARSDAAKSAADLVIEMFGAETDAGKIALGAKKVLAINDMILALQVELARINETAASLGPLAPAYSAVFTGLAVAKFAAGSAKVLGLGFKDGGYTGDGSTSEVAGVTHKNEMVLSAPVVASLGGPYAVERLTGQSVSGGMVARTNTQGYANGGAVGVSSAVSASSQNMATEIARAIAALNISVAVTDINKQSRKYARVTDRANS